MTAKKPAAKPARRLEKTVTTPTGGKAPRCQRWITSKDRQCRQPSVRGTTVCPRHGAATPQVRKAAARRTAEVEAERRASKALARMGQPVDIDPTGALLHVISTLHAHRLVLEQLLNADGIDLAADGSPHPLWDMWIRVAAEERKSAADAIRAGLHERRIRLAEAQGALLAEALRRIFDHPQLSLTQKQRIILGTVVRSVLTEIATEAG